MERVLEALQPAVPFRLVSESIFRLKMHADSTTIVRPSPRVGGSTWMPKVLGRVLF